MVSAYRLTILQVYNYTSQSLIVSVALPVWICVFSEDHTDVPNEILLGKCHQLCLSENNKHSENRPAF